MLDKAGADEASELDPDAFTRIMTGVLTKSDATPTTAAQVPVCLHTPHHWHLADSAGYIEWVSHDQ
jgi:hypothetical protein